MRAKLKSGRFYGKDKLYLPGDIINDIERLPENFRDMWEVLPPSSKRVAPAPIKKAEPVVKMEELPKKKTTRKPKAITKKATTSTKQKPTAKKTSSTRKK